ncbi:MAG: hypothetical protein EBY24_02160 [Betaproteobacteria bacterium]|nr:hypothetical protein [Betaproteobacteria bacterium]
MKCASFGRARALEMLSPVGTPDSGAVRSVRAASTRLAWLMSIDCISTPSCHPRNRRRGDPRS